MPDHIYAILNATDSSIPSIDALSPNARLMLQKFVRESNPESPSDSVRISNTNLALDLKVATKTICRTKAELENAGWIERHQVKSRQHGMQVADIWLTPWAQGELGLVPCVAEKLSGAPKQRDFSRTMPVFAAH